MYYKYHNYNYVLRAIIIIIIISLLYTVKRPRIVVQTLEKTISHFSVLCTVYTYILTGPVHNMPLIANLKFVFPPGLYIGIYMYRDTAYG